MRLPEDVADDEVERALERAGITPTLMEKAFALVSRALWLAKAREKLERYNNSIFNDWFDSRSRDKE